VIAGALAVGLCGFVLVNLGHALERLAQRIGRE
jgi:hypothetical protein